MTDKWHWLRHKWTQWTQYEASYDYHMNSGKVVHRFRTEIRQWRKCQTCSKLQDEIVTWDGKLQEAPESAN